MKETRFKQTEIGLIPEDWEVYDIYKMGIFSKGAGISRNESMTGNIPAIRYGEIYTHHNNVVRNFNSWISTSVAAKSTKIKCNDLLFAASGETKEEIGKCVAYIYNHDAYAGGDIIILTPKNHYNSIFLGYLMNSQIICKQKTSKGQGDAVVHITANSLSKIKCPIPDIEEQNKIASALTSIDNLLLSLDKLIEKKRLIKQGAMQELLTGKKRLPGFTGEWVEKRLGEISKIYRGGSPRPIENYITTMNDGINWIKIGDVDKSAKYIYKTQERIKPSGVSSSRYVKSGDFLLSNSMSFGRPYILKTSGCIHDGWLVIQDYQQYCDCDFLYYTLSSNYILQQYKAKAAGSSVLNLNKDIASNVIMKYPKDILEQKSIAKVLSRMDKEIESLEGKKAKYEQIKQGMIQQLLTGKIRLV